jgi:transposase
VFSPHLYNAHNLIERFVNKLKFFRRIATRCGELGSTFLAMIKLGAIPLYLSAYDSTA